MLGPRRAHAHDPFEITTDAHVAGDRLSVHTTMSLLTATRACIDGGSGSGRGRIEPPAFEAHRPELTRCARAFYRITAGGRDLHAREARIELTVEEDVDMRVVYPRPAQSPLVFEATALRKLSPRAGVVLTVTGQRTFLGQQLLRPDEAVFAVPITPDAEAPGTPPLPSFGQYLVLGVRHILTGADHLLFLAGLLVVCRRLRTVVGIITCFTAAHSVTLALAALNVVSLSPRIVEPLIAATIVFVGVENLARGDEPRGRWALTFGFGLVHGLGFASALRDRGLGSFGTSVVGPLIGFNLGVELGQLAVAAALLAALWQLRSRPAFARFGPRGLSLVVAGIGCVWLIQRLFA
jgi:hydrogenase/urease accessory protein HupE